MSDKAAFERPPMEGKAFKKALQETFLRLDMLRMSFGTLQTPAMTAIAARLKKYP